MKRKILSVLAIALVAVSCGKLEDQISALEQRIAQLEDSKIPSIDKQISSINGTISDMQKTDSALKDYIIVLQQKDTELSAEIDKTNGDIAVLQQTLRDEMASDKEELSAGTAAAKAEVIAQLDAYKVLMEGELATIDRTINSLKAQDSTLLVKIEELKTYVDSEISATKDWASATFATIEQQNALSETVAGIKTQLETLNTYTLNLNERLTNKTEELSQTIAKLDESTKDQIETLTGKLTDSISSLKTELTEAYTSLIAQEITELETSLKGWVNEQLSAYYTAEQVDAKLSAISEELSGRIDSEKAYLEGLITTLETSTNNKIAANTTLITSLRTDLTAAQGDIAENAGKIADDAILISQNTQKISENATAIAKNTTDVAAAKKLADDNSALISTNSTKISEMETLLETLEGNITDNAAAIVQNTKDIAANGSLIAQNTTDILSNKTDIQAVETAVTNLQSQLATTRTEIVEAYTAAIKKALEDYDGTITEKIASDISSVETKINDLQTSLTSLTTRVSSLEDRVDKVEEALESITSISYIPKYSDHIERVEYTRNVLEIIPGDITLKFDVHPASSAAAIAQEWDKVLSARAVYTMTKSSGGDLVSLEVKGASASDGILSVTISAKNLDKNFIVGSLDASVVVKISSESRQVMSEYVDLTPAGEEFSFISYLLTNFDSDGDGQPNDMDKAKSLTIPSMGLTYIDDILAQMPALTHVQCAYNKLTSLDFSNNPCLEYLNCSGNQLTSLNLSKNTELTTLKCAKNQSATFALDLSNNPKLASLDIGGSKMTSLVVINTALKTLYCDNLGLTSLIVSDNTALTSLSCSSNSLTTLDVSTNSALTYMLCTFNSLTNLDVSKNSALTTLICTGNRLTSLDLSANSALTYLSCDNNNLTSIDLSKNENLTHVDLFENGNLTRVVCKSLDWALDCDLDSDDSALYYLNDGTQITLDSLTTDINGKTWKQFNVGARLGGRIYGNLYTFDNAMTVCPTGWRLPTNDEFASLYLNRSDLTTYRGATGRWFSGSQTYSSSASAIFLPFLSSQNFGFYWSSTEYDSDYTYALNITTTSIYRTYRSRSNEYSVRCIKD